MMKMCNERRARKSYPDFPYYSHMCRRLMSPKTVCAGPKSSFTFPVAFNQHSYGWNHLLNTHSPICLTFRSSKIVQQGTAVELVIRGLNLFCLIDNKDGNAPDRQWSQVDLESPSDHIAGMIDVKRCHTRKWCFRNLLVDELLSRSECHRPELCKRIESIREPCCAKRWTSKKG
jgi:hypothetical protein